MMKSTPFKTTLTALVACVSLVRAADDPATITRAAQGVLARVTGNRATNVHMSVIPAEEGRDCYEFSATGGTLTLKGSSPVALSRAFQDYLKASNLGHVSWLPDTMRIPTRWPDAATTRLATPYEIRHAYNVVTAGYTFPYWTWERWEQELDWQAAHGFNMLMAPVATEAIMERVWLKMGLTQAEIDANTCGPAHLPWFRMGNICGIEGPLPKAWHTDQVALQHKILARMRELGMEPVVQSFAGFVPRGFGRVHPETKLHNTCWNGSLPKDKRPVLMLPDDPQFAAITKAYMDEWKKEFGPAKYFLVDSFNEMEIPKTSRPETELLADYGEKTWQAIHNADPDAIWAIQGWTFGYQNWKTENLRALFSKVPEDRLFLLDYANDYKVLWKPYESFWGRHWAIGYVPNMGGKTAYTGSLGFYATQAAKVLAEPGRGNLKGFTISGEGLENNELLYELLTDVAWSREPVDLSSWTTRYLRNRYGDCPPALAGAWETLRKGCYGNLQPHPGFKWQHFGGLDRNPNFHQAAAAVLSCADQLKGSPAYRADAVEIAALSLSLKADEWYSLTMEANAAGDVKTFDLASKRTLDLLTCVDRLMESHPLHRMNRWIGFARAHSKDATLRRYYESNARSIVTYWTKGVQNYSCRVWGGLVRDYYREWLVREFDSMKHGTPFDANRFMLDYVKGEGVSPAQPCKDPLADARHWLEAATAETLPKVVNPNTDGPSEPIGSWNPAQVSESWKTMEWPVPADKVSQTKGVLFTFTGGNHRLEIQSVEVVADGKVVATDKHSGYAGIPSKGNFYQIRIPAGTRANNGCFIRATAKSGGGTDSKGNVSLILTSK